MSDLQAPGLNFVDNATIIIASTDCAADTILLISAGGTFGAPAPDRYPIDGLLAQGHKEGVGVIGWGGQEQGSGVVGIANVPENLEFPPPPVLNGQGMNYGVIGSGGNAGVYGQGGSGTPGVKGQAGDGNADGVQGFGAGSFSGVAGFGDPKGSGTGVFGLGQGVAAPGVRGIGAGGPNTVPGDPCGVYGQAGTGNSNGVEGRGSGDFAGVAGFGDVSPGAAGGIGVFAVGGAPKPASGQPGGPGVYAVGFGGPGYTPLNQAVGVYGVGGASGAPGVHGTAGSGSGVIGESASGVGVRASSSTGTGVVAEGGNFGLIATANLPGGLAARFDGNVIVSGHLTVSGAKSAAVPFPDGSHRRLYCVESPESWFEDLGFGELVDGQAQVQFDPGFSSIITSDAYHVSITEYEDHNALYVTGRTSTGFVVRAKRSNANGTFSYRVVAKRKDISAPRFEEVSR